MAESFVLDVYDGEDIPKRMDSELQRRFFNELLDEINGDIESYIEDNS